MPPVADSIKALVFDVFGTVVDWRSSIIGEVQRVAARAGVTIDAAQFADAWRAGYQPSMQRVRSGEIPWTTLDQLHRATLDRILAEFGIATLSEREVDDLNRAWHRLDPWPDAAAGLARLKRKYIIAPLSNRNVSLITNMAKHAGLPWDCVLGAELARHYKPDPEVYLVAAQLLDLRVDQVMMVAAHVRDLQAAAAVGMRTAFVVRPAEYGPSVQPDLVADAGTDISAVDFNDLAQLLGA